MAKRLSTLTKFRLESVVRELKEIQAAHDFNKIDLWSIQQATGMLGFILDRSKRTGTKQRLSSEPDVNIKGPDNTHQTQG